MKYQAATQLQRRGFTLIELMIVVVIVSILAAIAYPSYVEQVKKGNRSAAKQWLLEISSVQASYVMDARDYGSLALISMATPPDRVADYYTVTLVEDQDCGGAASSPGYCVSAAPKAGTTQDGDVTLRLDHKGNKLPTDEWD